MNLYTELRDYLLQIDHASISDERKNILQPLIEYIQSKVEANKDVRINFICTHNSRRSLFSQIWAQTIALHFNIKNVTCYSGGTESTAVFPKVIESLEKVGFQIKKHNEDMNPIYSIKFSEYEHPVIGFSKVLDDNFNPTTEFVAIMTCDSASEACPFVPGAEKRIPIMYEDPKGFDNTPLQNEMYLKRSLQIATELHYVFSEVNP